MEDSNQKYWRRCSTCKSAIDFQHSYWVCNVSTCNRKRTGLVFCTVECWDAHLPLMNHREAWAEERTAPTQAAAFAESADVPRPSSASSQGDPSAQSGRTMSMSMTGAAAPPVRRLVNSNVGNSLPQEVLVVASKVKDFVRHKSEMNTSDRVMQSLSDLVRALLEDAIRRAQTEGRKTVLDRDIRFP